MTTEPRQIPMELPLRPALAAEDFLVSASNAAAVSLVERWPDWPAAAILVYGAAGAGKTHLLSVWRARSGGEIVKSQDISDGVVAHFNTGKALAVDDIDRNLADERVLFHLLNRAREALGTLLITARRPPGLLEAGIPDLRSRLRALPSVEIGPPDDALLQALLVKLFADRQLNVEPPVLQYLVRHMERSAEAAIELVRELDTRSLADKRRVTRVLASDVLKQMRLHLGEDKSRSDQADAKL